MPTYTPAPAKPGPIVYSDVQMLNTLRRLAGTNLMLSRPEYVTRAGRRDPTSHLYELRFGSWNQALAAAGLHTTPQPVHFVGVTTKWTRAQMLRAIARCAAQTGSTALRGYERRRMGQNTLAPEDELPPAVTIRARFGSWSQATALACDPRSHYIT